MPGRMTHHWLRATAGRRLVVAGVAGLAVGLVTTAAADDRYGPMLGWDAAAVVYQVGTWRSLAGLDAHATRRHATREDPSTRTSDLLLLAASVASLIAVGVVLGAGGSTGTLRLVRVALGIATVGLSWSVVHTLYCLRYARLYYSPPEGGISFGGDEAPTYADFAYLAYTIGMTYQVSDTAVGARAIRSAVMRHSLLSFLFGTAIISVTVNLVAGLS